MSQEYSDPSREESTMSKDVTNMDDVVDSRDIVARVEELESELDSSDDNPDGPTFDENDRAELTALRELVSEIDDNAGDKASDGVTLIRDSYFERYAQELADDMGMLDRSATWPYTCIDWEHAARELQYDYSSIEWDGVTYWVR